MILYTKDGQPKFLIEKPLSTDVKVPIIKHNNNNKFEL